MKAEYLQKRNQSLHRMLGCLAVGELIVWMLFGVPPLEQGSVPFTILCLTVLGFVVAALVHYTLACEHYAKAKGNADPTKMAGLALIFSASASPVLAVFALVRGSAIAAYFVVPAVFALTALSLKLMRDRA